MTEGHLFLTADGLETEMGDLMSHGAIVTREHGTPGHLRRAARTGRVTTGQRLAVDGSAGSIVVEPRSD